MSKKPSTHEGHMGVQRRHYSRMRTDPVYRAIASALRAAINDHKRPIDVGLIPSATKRIAGELRSVKTREVARRVAQLTGADRLGYDVGDDDLVGAAGSGPTGPDA